MEFLISANNLILDNWLISSETKQQHEVAFERCFPSQNHGINHAVQEAQKDTPEHKDEHIFEVLTTYGFVRNANDTLNLPVCPPCPPSSQIQSFPSPQKLLKVFKDFSPLIEKQVWRVSYWKL